MVNPFNGEGIAEAMEAGRVRTGSASALNTRSSSAMSLTCR